MYEPQQKIKTKANDKMSLKDSTTTKNLEVQNFNNEYEFKRCERRTLAFLSMKNNE